MIRHLCCRHVDWKRRVRPISATISANVWHRQISVLHVQSIGTVKIAAAVETQTDAAVVAAAVTAVIAVAADAAAFFGERT